jgi:PPE-repeat protein
MDFGVLPPEVNSGRMYTGAGSGPMLAAAAAWDQLAAQLHSTAASYGSVVSGLTTQWQGPSSTAMSAAVAPYVAWMKTTAAQAESTAMQARAAAAAYETAFAATVPPPAIAANRAQLTSLLATNFFGQNTAAIMANEAQYAEMWAQDAAAMYGYAGSSASASRMTPFSQPPQTTNPSSAAGQSAAAAQAAGAAAGTHAVPQLMSATPNALQSLGTPVAAAAQVAQAGPDGSLAALFSALNSFITGPLSPLSAYAIGGVPFLLGIQSYLLPQAAANLTGASEKVSKIPPEKLPPPFGPPASGTPDAGVGSGARVAGSTGPGAVSVSAGRAGMIGGVSVPQGWASAAPAIKTAAAMVPQSHLSVAPAALAADGQGSVASNAALSGLAGRAMAGTGGADRPGGTAGGATAKEFTTTTANIFVIHEADEAIPEAET